MLLSTWFYESFQFESYTNIVVGHWLWIT